MNYGPLIFLAAFFAVAGSWFSFVLGPQVQIGQLQATNAVTSGTYPVARPGIARQGLDVYRANGCAACHSQQIRQTGTACDVFLTDTGTNQTALLAALLKVKSGLTESEAKAMLSGLPKPVLEGVERSEADAVVKNLNATSAKSVLTIVPFGPDIARGWGKRHSVAEDYLFDDPVMLGSLRVGPDLANLGARQPDLNWHLRHLYAPRSEVKGSPMPPYRFLFRKHKIEQAPSPDALVLPADVAPPAGFEIVPTAEAKALAAYLVSLRVDSGLTDAPMSGPPVAAPPNGTNAPAGSTGTSTNAVGTNTPAK